MEGDELQSRFLVSVVDPTNCWSLVSEVRHIWPKQIHCSPVLSRPAFLTCTASCNAGLDTPFSNVSKLMLCIAANSKVHIVEQMPTCSEYAWVPLQILLNRLPFRHVHLKNKFGKLIKVNELQIQ